MQRMYQEEEMSGGEDRNGERGKRMRRKFDEMETGKIQEYEAREREREEY